MELLLAWQQVVRAEPARAFVAQCLEALAPVTDSLLIEQRQSGRFLVSSDSPIHWSGLCPDGCSLESYRTPGIDAICPAVWWRVGFRLSDESGVNIPMR